MKHEYWIDADGYLIYGIREKNEWESDGIVGKIPQHHIEPLTKILESHLQATPPDPQHGREPEPKPLAQYLGEYVEQEVNKNPYAKPRMWSISVWHELLEQALDAYESTEGVTIKIERK